MPLTAESLQRMFAEQVGRPLDPQTAAAAAGLVSMLTDALNAIDPEPLFLVEPNMAFEAAYRVPTGEGDDR